MPKLVAFKTINPVTLDQLKAECIAWNREHPVGTAVLFHPVIGKPGGRKTQTTSEAWVLSGHTAVVKLDGVPGCVALQACEVLEGE